MGTAGVLIVKTEGVKKTALMWSGANEDTVVVELITTRKHSQVTTSMITNHFALSAFDWIVTSCIHAELQHGIIGS